MIQTRAKNKVIIGSRESRLAVLQSEMVRDYIKEQHPGLDVEILTMKTTGDKIPVSYTHLLKVVRSKSDRLSPHFQAMRLQR